MKQNLEPIRSKIYEIRGHKEEFYGLNKNLIFQNGISSWGGTRKLPYAFTELGVAMLSSVLRSPLAIQVNIGREELRNLSTVAKFAIVQPEGTVKEYLTVQTEGNRNVIRKVKYYKNRQVKRNIERFPEDFMFQLTKEEYNSLRCHFGTSNRRGGDRRALPYAFTEQGIGMLSGILDAISEALAELQPREPKPRRHIGLERTPQVGIKHSGYNLVSKDKRPNGNWQRKINGWYIYSNISNDVKCEDLRKLSNSLNLGLKVEDGIE